MNIPAPIYVVDDDKIVCATLASIFRASGCGVRSFGSAHEFLDAAGLLPPGCLILDVRLPDMDGLALHSRLLARNLRFPMVMITGYGQVPLAVQAMKAGAVDFVEKPFSKDAILAAVETALRRLDPNAPARLAAGAQPGRDLARLSMRERQVLEGLLAGWPNKTIARRLGLSPRTVEIHRARLMDKMQASSLPELVRLALAAGIGPDVPAAGGQATALRISP